MKRTVFGVALVGAIIAGAAIPFSARRSTRTRHLVNRWTSSAIIGVCTFGADAVVHPSHYPGAHAEAALTGIRAFMFSLGVSYAPVGTRIDHLLEAFRGGQR